MLFTFIPKIFIYQKKPRVYTYSAESYNISHNNDAGNRFWIQVLTTLNFQIFTEGKLDRNLDSVGSVS